MPIKVGKNDFTRKIKYFNNCQICGQFGQNNCRDRLWKVAQNAINCPIWSHWLRFAAKRLTKSKPWVAAIAPWFRLRLPSCGPGFDPKHTIYAFFNYWNCNEKITKINKKRPGLAHLKKTKSKPSNANVPLNLHILNWIFGISRSHEKQSAAEWLDSADFRHYGNVLRVFEYLVTI